MAELNLHVETDGLNLHGEAGGVRLVGNATEDALAKQAVSSKCREIMTRLNTFLSLSKLAKTYCGLSCRKSKTP